MTRGKIVLVPLPFDDLTAQKAQPVRSELQPGVHHVHLLFRPSSSLIPARSIIRESCK
jgi:hypothetical protein